MIKSLIKKALDKHPKNNSFRFSFLVSRFSFLAISIFLLSLSVNAQIKIKEKVEIEPATQTSSRIISDGGGWWIDTCYITNYDSSEIDLTFTPLAIEPDETTIMTVDYNEELHNFLERNITLEPDIGSIVRIGNSEYKYYAPSSTPGDTALVVRIYYEQFQWYCAYGDLKQDSIRTNNTLEDYQCGCPVWTWTQVNRRYGIDSIMIAWDSLDVKVEPDTIYPGDTAQVVIKKRLPDGTLTEFDSTLQFYEVGMLDGCILGKIVAGTQEGSHVYGVSQPIYFVADTSADTTGSVLLRVGLVEPSGVNKPNKEKLQTYVLESDCFLGWQSESYDEIMEFVDERLEIIYPTDDTTELITEDPYMPTINCKARLKDYSGGGVNFEWEYWVRYNLNRHAYYTADTLCSRTGMVKIIGTSTADNSDTTLWSVPFMISNVDSVEFKAKHYTQDGGCDAIINVWDEGDSVFIGGYIFVKVTAKNSIGQILGIKQQDGGKILGSNPDVQSVKNYANPTDYKAIIYHESERGGIPFQQFNSKNYNLYYKTFNGWLYGWKYNKKGYPTYGIPNGYGLAQIDNSPAPSEMDLWNWKHNLETGKERFNLAKINSMNYILSRGASYQEDKFLMNAYQNYNSNKRYWNWNNWDWSTMTLWNYRGKVGWIENSRRPNNYGKIVYQIYLQLINK